MIANSSGNKDRPPPNVIFVLADDLGWGDLGCYGHDVTSPDLVDSSPNRVMTPNLDRMAAEGKLFTRYYVNAPMCSPARAGLMTGVHPSRQGIHFWQNEAGSRHNQHFGLADYVDPSLPNLANTLRGAGYATAHFGKWHIGFGEGAPAVADYGFDEVKVLTQGNGPSYGIRANHPRGTEYLIDDTIDFISRHRDRPFFANVWLRDVHAALDPSPESLARYRHLMSEGKFVTAMQVYFAAITEMDLQIGRLLDAVDQLGLGEDTIVMFSSDNGPEDIYIPHAGHHAVGLPGPFRGRKRSLYDGGVRVPFILRWKGHTPIGQVDDQTVLCGTDLLPTLARLAGAQMPGGLDGEDMSDAFVGTGRRRETDLFWEWRYEGVGQQLNRSPGLAVLSGEWKLLFAPDRQVFELYHLRERDDCELHSQHEVYPDVVEALAESALAWRETLP
ncbi:MAG: sulfatase-like hydrolase/transferase, partial [Planctomycetota bacterium]